MDVSAIFAASKSNTIDIGGESLHSILELQPPPGVLFLVFRGSNSTTKQGVRFKIRDGALTVNGATGKDFVVWRDTAPPEVQIEIAASGSSVLKIWNVWLGGLDVTQAWLGNAAMRVTKLGGDHDLAIDCSDGVGALDLHNLRFELRASGNIGAELP